MSKLLELKARIEKLPELQKQKQNNAKVVTFKGKVDHALSDVKKCAERRSFIQTVFPLAKLKKTVDAVKHSKSQAARLSEKLNSDFDEINSNETDKKITRIGERNTLASEEIQKTWSKSVEDELKPLRPLIEIVQEALLPNHDVIAGQLANLEAAIPTVPDSVDSAQGIRDELDALRESLADLELEGAGGEFLKKAVKGRANAKDLLKDEVREFLDAKDLWGILKIRVGN
jgi:hypothetical protein